jgi:hypothetical protein
MGLIGATAGAVRLWRLTRWHTSRKETLCSPAHIVEVEAISNRLNINTSRIKELQGIFSPTRFMSERLLRHGSTWTW